MTESEVNYVRGQVDEIIISKSDFETLKIGHSINIDCIKIRIEID